jgi:hypothetical protein
MNKIFVTGAFALIIALGVGLTACETADPTEAVVDNAYPAPPDGGDVSRQNVVYRAWWSVVNFTDPVPAGSEGPVERAVTSTDYAYAVLAVNWDPASGSPPTTLLPLKSAETLHVERGATLHIMVSDDTMVGNCAAGKPLSQDDADFITQRVFPGAFAGVAYDAAHCVTTPLPTDGGTDAGVDG